MAAIVNLPQHEDWPAVQGLPGDLPPPPAAKFAEPLMTFDEIEKPETVESSPPPRPLRRGAVLPLALATLLLLAGWGTLAAQCLGGTADGSGDGGVAEWRRVMEDPVDDLRRMFQHAGLEPADTSRCPSCFFQDPGRVRRSAAAPDAFLVYKGAGIEGFEVVTHMFQPQLRYAEPHHMPLTFWAAEDADGDGHPDAWQPVPAEYRRGGCRMGWERGQFRGHLAAPHPFLKVALSAAAPTGGPQIGQVLLYSATRSPSDAAPATDLPHEESQQLVDIANLMDSIFTQVFQSAMRSTLATGTEAPVEEQEGGDVEEDTKAVDVSEEDEAAVDEEVDYVEDTPQGKAPEASAVADFDDENDNDDGEDADYDVVVAPEPVNDDPTEDDALRALVAPVPDRGSDSVPDNAGEAPEAPGAIPDMDEPEEVAEDAEENEGLAADVEAAEMPDIQLIPAEPEPAAVPAALVTQD